MRIITRTLKVRIIALYGASAEYVLHSLLWLAESNELVSSLDLADLQEIPGALMAKLLSRLEKAGIPQASEGLKGGYRLARSAYETSILAVIDVIERRKSLFSCQDIRGRCVLFDEGPSRWATQGVCGIHAVMLRAEQAMRQELERISLTALFCVGSVFAETKVTSLFFA